MPNKLFFEMLALVAFFATYYITKNMFLATGVCIAASWVSLILCKILYKSVSKNTWLSTILITIFGGLTIFLHNKTFVMLKPTVLFWILGAGLIIGQLFGKNSMELMLKNEISMSQKIWKTLNLSWGLFFIVLGGLNLYIALNFSEYVWVKFKVFGSMGLTIVFAIISSIIIFLVKNHEEKNGIAKK
jgi:intracellular septation protein